MNHYASPSFLIPLALQVSASFLKNEFAKLRSFPGFTLDVLAAWSSRRCQ